MTEQEKRKGRPKGANDIDVEIQQVREKLRKLEEKKKAINRKQAEENAKAVWELIKSSNLEKIPANNWQEKIQQIADLLRQ